MNEFVGQNFRGMMISLKAKYKYEMSDAQLETYVSLEEDRVIAKLKESLKPCVGADDEYISPLLFKEDNSNIHGL